MYMNRYLACRHVAVNRFQLLGAAALQVASKVIGKSFIPSEALCVSMNNIFSAADLKVSLAFILLSHHFFFYNTCTPTHTDTHTHSLTHSFSLYACEKEKLMLKPFVPFCSMPLSFFVFRDKKSICLLLSTGASMSPALTTT